MQEFTWEYIVNVANVWLIRCPLNWVTQVFLLIHTCTVGMVRHRLHRKGDYGIRFMSQPVILTSGQLSCSAAVRAREWKDNKADGQGTEKEILFALSLFAQFSAGQILAQALYGSSPLLGFIPPPTPHAHTHHCLQRLKWQKRGDKGREEVGDKQ